MRCVVVRILEDANCLSSSLLFLYLKHQVLRSARPLHSSLRRICQIVSVPESGDYHLSTCCYSDADQIAHNHPASRPNCLKAETRMQSIFPRFSSISAESRLKSGFFPGSHFRLSHTFCIHPDSKQRLHAFLSSI